MDFGLFLRVKRQEANLSQKAVSDELGYHHAQFVSNWERGVALPPISKIKKIANMYKISEEELFEIVLARTIAGLKETLERKFYGAVRSKQRKVS